MIGGLQKNISRLAIIAAAGAMSSTAAMSADLGGNCCADLEERVAELEATTARKGNRRVSLTVSGHVHEAIVFWDVDNTGTAGPEDESNVYIGTHNSSRSRFRFRGNATINADWSAGFFMEIGVRANHLGNNSQDSSINTSGLDIRHEALYVKSKRYGTFWLGWTSSASDGITEICIGCGLGNGPDFSDDMGDMLAGNNTRFDRHASNAGAFVGEGDRREVVRYISPTIAGFVLSTSFSQDDYWDVALRYAGEFGAFRVGAGIAYSQDTGVDNATAGFISASPCTETQAFSDKDCESLGLSVTAQHVPTGLYFAYAYGQAQDNNVLTGSDTDSGHHVTAGMNRKLNSLGKTNIWGMYTHNEREIGSISELKIYGVGIDQKIDAAAMDLYVWYKHFDAEADGAETGDMDMVVVGARIQF